MKREVLYKYLGTNGTILSAVHLEDVYYVRYVRLTADKGKTLTNKDNYLTTMVTIPEQEEADWQEISNS